MTSYHYYFDTYTLQFMRKIKTKKNVDLKIRDDMT